MVRKGGGKKAGGLWNPESNMVGGRSQQKQMTLEESNQQVDLVGRDLAHEEGSIWVPPNFQPQIYERRCEKQIADITTPLLGGGSLL